MTAKIISNMKQSFALKVLIFVPLVCFVLFTITACGENSSSTGSSSNGSGGAVAATVNGSDIYEDDVTEYIQTYRQLNDLEDDAAWASYLSENQYTPEGLRSDSINFFFRKAILENLSNENHITVSDDEINEQITSVKDYYGTTSDEEWTQKLKDVGYTPDGYYDYVREALLEQKLMDAIIDNPEVSDDEIINMANEYATEIDGAVKISVIEFADRAEAEDVSNRIASGELSFDDAKNQYSSEHEYDGWSCLITIDSALVEQAKTMEISAVSGVIDGPSGFYIIRLDEMLNIGDEGITSVSVLPEDIYNVFYNSALDNDKYTLIEQYLDDQLSTAETEIKEMPSGLPYDVAVDVEQSSNEIVEEQTDSDVVADEPTDDVVVEENVDATVDEPEATDDGIIPAQDLEEVIQGDVNPGETPEQQEEVISGEPVAE